MSDNDRPADDQVRSRRTLFKVAGVGLAGVAGAALLESPAEATTGLSLGVDNTETAATSLTASGSGSAVITALTVIGYGGGHGLLGEGGSAGGAGLYGLSGGGSTGVIGLGNNGSDTVDAGDGVFGEGGESGGTADGGTGVRASGGSSIAAVGGVGANVDGGDGVTSGGDGARITGGDAHTGSGGNGGDGVTVTGGDADGSGYSGTGITAYGGEGTATAHAGIGIFANGGSAPAGGSGAVGLYARGGSPEGAPLQLQPNGLGGPPTMGAHTPGEIWMDGTAVMWVCVLSGTPGTWLRVLAVPKSGAGATHLLAHPIRLFNATIAAKHNATVHVAGHKVAGLEVPKGAVGVIGTLGVSKTGTHGYLSTFATAPHTSTPLTTSLTWSAKKEALSAQVTVALTAAGTCVIANGYKGNSTTAHVTFDVVGYLA